MEDSTLKSRAQGAVDSERMQLLSIIAHHWEELESYEYGGGTQKQKWDLWEAIGNEFNAHPSVTVTRTPLQVKTLFKNMKTKARKYKFKLESSKSCGVIIESDPVSETVLQLTKVQSKVSLKTFLDSLKRLCYFDPKTNMPISASEMNEVNSPDSSDSPNLSMAYDSEDVPDIKEEVIEAFDSPCIIREDESPIVFPSSEDRSEHSSDGCISHSDSTSTAPQHVQDASDSSEIHTFGDISVTAISSEKKSSPNGLKVVSPVSLGLTVKHHNSFVSDSANKESETTSERPGFQSKTVLTTPLTLGLVTASKLIERDFTDRAKASPDCSSFPSKVKPSTSTSVAKSGGGRTCCCPEYHKRMISLVCKEHEMNISLLNEKILAKREERRLHEEERRFREQNFLLKQEERRALMAEHQARMRLIELECEAAQKRIKTSERTNKWLFRSCSKEI